MNVYEIDHADDTVLAGYNNDEPKWCVIYYEDTDEARPYFLHMEKIDSSCQLTVKHYLDEAIRLNY